MEETPSRDKRSPIFDPDDNNNKSTETRVLRHRQASNRREEIEKEEEEGEDLDSLFPNAAEENVVSQHNLVLQRKAKTPPAQPKRSKFEWTNLIYLSVIIGCVFYALPDVAKREFIAKCGPFFTDTAPQLLQRGRSWLCNSILCSSDYVDTAASSHGSHRKCSDKIVCMHTYHQKQYSWVHHKVNLTMLIKTRKLPIPDGMADSPELLFHDRESYAKYLLTEQGVTNAASHVVPAVSPAEFRVDRIESSSIKSIVTAIVYAFTTIPQGGDNNSTTILCMHHLKLTVPRHARICVMRRFYGGEYTAMINPELKGFSETSNSTVRSEFPLGCGSPTVKLRRNIVEILYQNEFGTRIRSLLEDHFEPHDFQMAWEELRGTYNCTVPLATTPH